MRTKTTFLLKTVMVAMLYFLSVNTFAAKIQISNEAGLRNIANDLAGEYELTADITLTSDWTPIGDDTNRFTGSVNGNGKTIYGLTVKNSSINGAGFIGVAEGATIENLKIVGAQIYGGQDVGGVVGRAYAPTVVEKCYTSGAISGYDHIGGIVGGTKKSNPEGDFSYVTDCYSTAVVVSTSWQAGGILGLSIDAEVANTYFAGVAICSSGRTAGIVAYADGGTTQIRKSVVMSPYLKGDETNRVFGARNVDANAFCTMEKNYSWENTQVYRKSELYTEGVSDPNDVDGEHVTADRLKSAALYTSDLGWNTSIWKIEAGNYPVFTNQSYPLDADGIYVPLFAERILPGTTFNAAAISALGRTIAYSSSDPAVASIDANGLVTFKKDGPATLTFTTTGDASYKGITLNIPVNVEGISYQIRTEQDLRNIKYDLSGVFTLMNDIVLTKEWEVIGLVEKDVIDNPFKGTLNGNGHVIYGLTFNNKDYHDTKNEKAKAMGLFGYAVGATITKLGIEGANILANTDVGAIVGEAKGCTISECYVANSYIAGRDHVGSIVGAMRAYDKVITPANPDADPPTPVVTEKVYTTVSNCYASAEIYSREYQAAGIAGIICGGTIENCYFSGTVKVVNERGAGIVSLLDSDDDSYIKNCINLAAAVYCKETYRIGNWAGKGTSYMHATNNWSAERSYFGMDFASSNIKTGTVNDPAGQDGCNLSNDNLARSQSFYSGTLNWDFNNTWKYFAGTDGKMYPVLKWQKAPVASKIYGIPEVPYLMWTPTADAMFDTGKIFAANGQELVFTVTEGSKYVDVEGNPFPKYLIKETRPTEEGWTKVAISLKESAALSGVLNTTIPKLDIRILFDTSIFDISTPAQLVAVNDILFANYRLVNNIDMTGVDFKGIGSKNDPYTGTFDGNGYSVINAVVTTGGENTKGFFNATRGATIQKLGLVNFSFSGSSQDNGSADLGGFVGSAKSTNIKESYVTGNIVGRDHVGGFVGGDCESVTIKNCFANVNINAGNQAGGIFGVTAGDGITIENCYFNGTITLKNNWAWAGGIIGLIDRAGTIKINNTVTIGNVNAGGDNGGKIGSHIAGNNNAVGTVAEFNNNLWNFDAMLSGKPDWTPEASSLSSISQKSPDQLKQKATYTTIGWDFNNIWSINEGQGYPVLKNVPLPTGIDSPTCDVKTYSIYTENNYIYVSGIEQSAKVSIYNVNGQEISQAVIENNTGLVAPSKGFYIISITENGKTVSLKAIVK